MRKKSQGNRLTLLSRVLDPGIFVPHVRMDRPGSVPPGSDV